MRCRRPLPSGVVTTVTILLLALPTLSDAAPPVEPICPNACNCRGTDNVHPPVKAAAVLACIIQGQAVRLDRVQVRGGHLDLDKIPTTVLRSAPPPGIPGVKDARDGLQLESLERELGRVVSGARLVREPVFITNSVIAEGITLAAPTRERVTPFSPVAFLQAVDLQGTTVSGPVTLPYARFRLSLNAVNAVFENQVNLQGARFADTISLANATLYQRTSFADTTFEGEAVFTSLEVGQEGSLDFSRSRFLRGATFKSEGRSSRLRDTKFLEAQIVGGAAVFEAVTFEGSTKFTKAQFGGDARFSGAHFLNLAEFDATSVKGEGVFAGTTIFSAGAEFAGARFEGKPAASFDGAQFLGIAGFRGARFVGTTSFTGGNFGRADFLDVEFEGATTFVGREFGTAEFGSVQTKTTFQGRALFDFARFDRANFENVQFRGRTSFAGARFGVGTACADHPVVVNFAGTSFSDSAEFAGAIFGGHVNLSYTSVEPSRLLLRWRQLEGRVASQVVRLDESAECGGSRQFIDLRRDAMPRNDLLRGLERTFRSRDLAADANAVSQDLQAEEAWSTILAGERCGERLQALGTVLFFGIPSGYGMRPFRAFLMLAAILVAGWALYLTFARAWLRADREWTVQRTLGTLPWRSVESASSTARAAELAWWVSMAALVSFQVRGAHVVILPGKRRWLWFALAAERICGYALVILLAYALGNSFPLLARLLAWAF